MKHLATLKRLRPAPLFIIPHLALETGQVIARLCWSVALPCYLYFQVHGPAMPQQRIVAILAAVQLAFALVYWALSVSKTGTKSIRTLAAAATDQFICAALIYFAGEIFVPFIFMPVLLTFGSGIRYGRAHALISSALGGTLTGAAVHFSPYWVAFPLFQISLVTAIFVLPLYLFRLTDALKLEMRTDALTRLTNAAGYAEVLARFCDDSATSSIKGAVVFIDLDGFKKVNDTQGHDVGDSVLLHIGYWLKTELHKFGITARIGGDEFAVVVPNLLDSAQLEAALENFSKRAIGIGTAHGGELGASIGVFYVEPQTPVTPRYVKRASDQLMYEAKRRGRKQIVTSADLHFNESGELIAH